MDKYINLLFIKLSQTYKVSLITIMTYNEEYKKAKKSYNLVLSKGRKRESIRVTNKRDLIMEMMKWANLN